MSHRFKSSNDCLCGKYMLVNWFTCRATLWHYNEECIYYFKAFEHPVYSLVRRWHNVNLKSVCKISVWVLGLNFNFCMFYGLASLPLPAISPLGVKGATTGWELTQWEMRHQWEARRSMSLQMKGPTQVLFRDRGYSHTSLVVAWGIWMFVSCLQGVKLICKLSTRDVQTEINSS